MTDSEKQTALRVLERLTRGLYGVVVDDSIDGILTARFPMISRGVVEVSVRFRERSYEEMCEPLPGRLLTPNPDAGLTPELSGVKRFYTIAFDADIMKQVLTFEYGQLLVNEWIDGVVPECYRVRVREIALEVFERSFLFRPYTIDLVIDELRRAIWRSLEPIEPGCEHK